MKKLLGTIISGSLTEGFVMRIDPKSSLEEIKTGKFVSIVAQENTFFSLVTDLTLQVTHPDILLFPPTAARNIININS